MRRGTSRLAAAGAGALMCAGTWLAPAAADPAQTCDTSPALTICVTADDPAYAASSVRVDMSGALAPTTQAGDQVMVGVPAQLHFPVGASYDIIATDGAVMGKMTVGTEYVTITWNNWIESHPLNASWQAFLSAQVTDDVVKGPNSLTWTVDGTVMRTSINGGTCDNDCTTMPDKAGKWATQYDTDTIDAGLVSPTVTTAGTKVTWTDTVGPGQKIQCDTVSGAWYASKDPKTGWLRFGNWITPTIQSCDSTHVTATFDMTEAGKVYGLTLRIKITDPTLDGWSDAGTVTLGTDSQPVEAKAYRYSGGGAGTGENAATASGSPTTTSSPTTTTSPSTPVPSVTASGSPTGSGSPTASGSATVSPEGSATATPSETATVDVPVVTPQGSASMDSTPVSTAATTTVNANAPIPAAAAAAPAPASLARTGQDSTSLIELAAGLLAVGAAMVMGARRTAPLRSRPGTHR